MSAKSGFSYVELMIMMCIIAIVAMMSLATWRPPRDEYGNTIYTKDGKYVNDFRKVDAQTAEYERHVDEFKGAGRIDGMEIEKPAKTGVDAEGKDIIDQTLLNTIKSNANYLKSIDADENGKIDEVPVIIQVYRGSDVTNPSNLLVETTVSRIVQDGQLFVVEYGDE